MLERQREEELDPEFILETFNSTGSETDRHADIGVNIADSPLTDLDLVLLNKLPG